MILRIWLIAETARVDSGDKPHQMWTACSAGQPLQIRHLCGYLQALTLPPDQHTSSRQAAIHAKDELESHLSNKVGVSDVGLFFFLSFK